MDAIVLAGAPADNDMIPKEGYTSRGMVEIGEKTMLDWVVGALKASGKIDRVVVIGDVAVDGADEILAPDKGFLENIMLGLRHTNQTGHVLVASCDIPLVTPEAIADFITCAVDAKADFCYPVIKKEVCLAKYPDMARTYLKTREGTLTGGNVVLVSPEFMKRNEEAIKQAYAARKKVLSLARMIGFGLLLKAIVSQLAFPGLLSVPYLEKQVGRMLGGSVKAVISSYPEIGEDVDKLSDLEAVRKMLGKEDKVETGRANG